MAFEAVQFNAGGYMTAATEMLVFIIMDARHTAIATGSDMAVDTFDQAMRFAANTLVHGLIALVQQVFHVVGAHICGRFYTFFTLWSRHDIAVRIPIWSAEIASSKAAY